MTTESTQKFSLPVLTAMVVGSMVGAGIFSLPQTFGYRACFLTKDHLNQTGSMQFSDLLPA